MTVLTGATELPDGSLVRGRGLRAPLPDGPIPQFGLYLGSLRLRRRYEGTMSWPSRWVQWPDFWLPRDSAEAISLITELSNRAQAGERVEVACHGGVGRTGTVVACLAILAGVAPRDAVTWARAHYHPRAVEMPWQSRWVTRFPTSPR